MKLWRPNEAPTIMTKNGIPKSDGCFRNIECIGLGFNGFDVKGGIALDVAEHDEQRCSSLQRALSALPAADSRMAAPGLRLMRPPGRPTWAGLRRRGRLSRRGQPEEVLRSAEQALCKIPK